MKAPYIRNSIYSMTGCLIRYEYKELNMTGRWKLKTDKFGDTEMFIEHRGKKNTEWVEENKIEILQEEQEVIYECGR